jgi:hypothetical protein
VLADVERCRFGDAFLGQGRAMPFSSISVAMTGGALARECDGAARPDARSGCGDNGAFALSGGLTFQVSLEFFIRSLRERSARSIQQPTQRGVWIARLAPEGAPGMTGCLMLSDYPLATPTLPAMS